MSVSATAAEVVADVPDFGLEDDDFVAGVMVLALVKDGRGQTGVYCRHSEGLAWTDRLAMCDFAAAAERDDAVRRLRAPNDEDDD